VQLPLQAGTLAHWDAANHRCVKAGQVKPMVGSSSDSRLAKTIAVVQ
jgi:hypothetical protein